MNIYINGQTITLTANNILSAALEQFLTTEQQQLSFAVALNGDFIGKPHYGSTQISDGDSIDILFPIQGG